MSIVVWIILGLIAGFIGSKIVNKTGQGLIMDIVLGIVGAIVGGRIFSAFGATGVTGLNIWSLIVAISAVVVVLIGAGVAHLLSEDWVAPGQRHLLLLAGAGLFLIFGHFFIFMAYRVGPTGMVAPFYYCFTVWAVISGLVVFAQFPNALAVGGILLVVASGLTIVTLDERRRRLTIVA